jgi:glucokinase
MGLVNVKLMIPFCRTLEEGRRVLAELERNGPGGVYLGGGLPRRLLPVLTQPGFLDRFRDKGRLSSFLRRVPLHVVTRPNVGLLGALQYALAVHDD